MIKLLFKIIHFESDEDHSKNIHNTFLFIWIVLSIIGFVLVYLLFTLLELRNRMLDYFLVTTGLLVSVVLYYLIRIKQAKSFVERGWDKNYFDYGILNRLLKPLIVLLIIFSIVLISKGLLMVLI